FLNFPKDYPVCKTIVLGDNYRSTPEILATADTLIKNNIIRFNKSLTTKLKSGPRPLFYYAKNAQDESLWILEEIKKIYEKDPFYKHIAILCRSNFLTRSLEHALVKEKVPYRILSGTEFYHRKEIKDAICYLRMLVSADDMAFLRVINEPSRKIGKKSLEKISLFSERNEMSLYEALKSLSQFDQTLSHKTAPFISLIEGLKLRKDELSLSDLFQMVLDKSGLEAHLRLRGDTDRLDNLAELKRSVEEFGNDPENTLEDFLHQAALFTDLDREKKEDSVSLMTIHTAKGLEFKSVFILGLSEGIFPSRRVSSPEEMEEERRLFYVAITRAKRRLYLSSAEGMHAGLVQTPSRFLKEIRECLRGVTEGDLEVLKQGCSRKVIRADIVENLFEEGDRVEHSAFGKGFIIKIDLQTSSYLIKFDALKTHRSIMFGTELKSLK
ncbi:MAG: ATP-binding domain-containing protein, partial [Deltaproteobacteria bacterium]|nr:ATP-binding domain-containing protein [Deltaproteobacteria bacterium]